MNNLNKELKVKYKNDFTELTKLVNSFDPCGLIEGGAPDDEYDSITQQLLSFAYNRRTKDEMRELILHEIEHYFGTPDLKTMNEADRTKFYRDLDELLSHVEQRFR